jgi:hypothetical protein
VEEVGQHGPAGAVRRVEVVPAGAFEGPDLPRLGRPSAGRHLGDAHPEPAGGVGRGLVAEHVAAVRAVRPRAACREENRRHSAFLPCRQGTRRIHITFREHAM